MAKHLAPDSKPKTQAEEVIDYIKLHGSIDTVRAFTDLYITRLAAVIHELVEAGFDIKRGWKHKYDENGKVVSKMMEYWL